MQRFFDLNRRASAAIAPLLPQARLDMEREYRRAVLERLEAVPRAVVADVGGGRATMFGEEARRAGAKVVAVDSDPNELDLNKDADETRVADITSGLPFGDAEVDLVVSHSVLEHLADVDAFFAHARRVLKPGGYTVHLLASKFAPYALINQALPDRVSRRIVTYLRPGSEGILGFPAVYDRCYDSAIRATLASNGFEVVSVRHGYYQSEYFAFFVPFFVVSSLYELAISAVRARNLCARVLVVARRRDS